MKAILCVYFLIGKSPHRYFAGNVYWQIGRYVVIQKTLFRNSTTKARRIYKVFRGNMTSIDRFVICNSEMVISRHPWQLCVLSPRLSVCLSEYVFTYVLLCMSVSVYLSGSNCLSSGRLSTHVTAWILIFMEYFFANTYLKR